MKISNLFSFIFLCLFATSCMTQKQACERASHKINRAIEICPDIAKKRVDTFYVNEIRFDTQFVWRDSFKIEKEIDSLFISVLDSSCLKKYGNLLKRGVNKIILDNCIPDTLRFTNYLKVDSNGVSINIPVNVKLWSTNGVLHINTTSPIKITYPKTIINVDYELTNKEKRQIALQWIKKQFIILFVMLLCIVLIDFILSISYKLGYISIPYTSAFVAIFKVLKGVFSKIKEGQ